VLSLLDQNLKDDILQLVNKELWSYFKVLRCCDNNNVFQMMLVKLMVSLLLRASWTKTTVSCGNKKKCVDCLSFAIQGREMIKVMEYCEIKYVMVWVFCLPDGSLGRYVLINMKLIRGKPRNRVAVLEIVERLSPVTDLLNECIEYNNMEDNNHKILTNLFTATYFLNYFCSFEVYIDF